MKKPILLITIFLALSCNFPVNDSVTELPNNYIFSFEGGSLNRIARNHQFVLDSGAVSASYNEKYIFFSEDTTYSMMPKKVSKRFLRYYICDIKKDTLSKPLNYDFFKRFLSRNKIDEDLDISKEGR